MQCLFGVVVFSRYGDPSRFFVSSTDCWYTHLEKAAEVYCLGCFAFLFEYVCHFFLQILPRGRYFTYLKDPGSITVIK